MTPDFEGALKLRERREDINPACDLNETVWIHSTGNQEEFKRRREARAQRLLSDIGAVAAKLQQSFPAILAHCQLKPSLDYFLGAATRQDWPILLHPSLGCWLFYARLMVESGGKDIKEGQALLDQFHGFAASLACMRADPLEARAVLDNDGHFHFHGMRTYLDFGRCAAGKHALLRFGAGGLAVRLDGGRQRHIPRNILMEGSPSVLGVGGGFRADDGTLRVRYNHPVTPAMEVNDCDPLILIPFSADTGGYNHRAAKLSRVERARFAAVLKKTLAQIKETDADLHRELSDSIRVIIPLVRRDPKVHVSSTYSQLPGAIGLCHEENLRAQAEALIHEFCHNKLHLILEADPILEKNDRAVFYSPWRTDPRPLRGLLLGAHAFLNVARYLAHLAAGCKEKDALPLQEDAAFRCLQVDLALRAVAGHGTLTEFGRRFLLGMQRSLFEIYDLLPRPPGGVWGAAQEQAAPHLKLYGRFPSVYHKDASL